MLISYIRTAVLYLILFIVIRLMGKRQIGQMEPAEFVVSMLVANLATIPMQDAGIPLYSGLVPILTVLGIEVVLSTASMRSIRLRKLLCGKPVILVENGRILQANLRSASITLDELSGHLRQKDVLDVKAVQYAILETDGNISVFPYPRERPASAADAGIQPRPQYLPVTIIADGHLFKDNLPLVKKDMSWVEKILKKHNASLSDTWLLMVNEGDQVTFFPKEGPK